MSRQPRSLSAALAEWLYRWRLWLSAGILIGAVLLAPLANFTAIDNELTAWFAPDDPVYQRYERLRDEFGGTRTLIVAIEAPSRDRLLSDEGLGYIDDVTAAIDRVAVVERVVSLATATVIDARPSDDPGEPAWLDVRALFDDLDTMTPDEVGQRAIDDELLRGDLISEDGTVAAIVTFFDESAIDDVRAETLEDIRAIVQAGLPDGFRAYYNGSIEISETYTRITLDNQMRLTPPILLLTAVALFAMFRSWRHVMLTMFAVMVSLVWTLGIYSLLGFSYNVLSSIIVPMTVVLAVADDVHIIQHFIESRRTQKADEAFKTTVRHLFAPILGATATTALGMASLGTSHVTAVREFGFGAAVGVSMDFAISLTLVPTLLCWIKPTERIAPQEAWFKAPLLSVARFSIRRAGLVAAVAGMIIVWATVGLWWVRVDTNHINFFARSHPLTESARVIDDRLAGIYTYQVMLEGPPDSLREPDILRRMDALEEELREMEDSRKVTGLADYVKRVHRELADGLGERGIPDDPSLVAQELFVFALADQGRIELQQVAASDFSKAQITVKQASMSSDLLYAQMNDVEEMAAGIFNGTDVRSFVTGSGHMFATLDTYLVQSQITSFTTAFITVFSVIFIVFRSWRFGLLSIVPNLFPVLAVFGVMGWLDISLNVATVMLASVALGVVDDDTVHFISRYRRETANGRTAPEAIEAATIYEGRAALTAAVINSSAFAVLAMSEYKPTAWFGGLLALTMIVAFLAEVFILPATITLFPRIFGPERVHAGLRSSTVVCRERAVTAALLLAGAIAASVASVAPCREQSACPGGLKSAPPAVERSHSPDRTEGRASARPNVQSPAPRDWFDAGGELSVLFDWLPRRDVYELRPRLRADVTFEPSDWLRFYAEGLIEGVAAGRNEYGRRWLRRGLAARGMGGAGGQSRGSAVPATAASSGAGLTRCSHLTSSTRSTRRNTFWRAGARHGCRSRSYAGACIRPTGFRLKASSRRDSNAACTTSSTSRPHLSICSMTLCCRPAL